MLEDKDALWNARTLGKALNSRCPDNLGSFRTPPSSCHSSFFPSPVLPYFFHHAHISIWILSQLLSPITMRKIHPTTTHQTPLTPTQPRNKGYGNLRRPSMIPRPSALSPVGSNSLARRVLWVSAAKKLVLGRGSETTAHLVKRDGVHPFRFRHQLYKQKC